MCNVLVTGISGFIGSSLALRLVKEGKTVVGIVRDLKPQSALNLLGLKGRANIVFGNILNQNLMERVIADYEIDTIFHLAAEAIVAHAQRAPVQAVEINVLGAATVLEAARVCGGVKAIVHTATDHVYGINKLPYTEDLPLLADTPYDASKAAGDIIARMYAHTYGLRVTVARPANTYGQGDIHRRIIPNAIRNCLANESPVIFKKDGVREYIFVDDTVSALIFLAENIEKAKGEAYNIGTGDIKNNDEVVKEILKWFPGIKPTYMPTDIKEIPRQYLDASKIRKLGWEPKTSFEAGISATISWWRSLRS